MPTGNVTTTHQSGGLTVTDVIPDRVHAKVGQAEGGEANKVYYIRTLKQAKDIFDRGALVDSLTQYFEEFDESIGQRPAPVICIRPETDTVGTATVNTTETVNTQGATLTADGTITGTRKILVKIIKGGTGGLSGTEVICPLRVLVFIGSYPAFQF